MCHVGGASQGVGVFASKTEWSPPGELQQARPGSEQNTHGAIFQRTLHVPDLFVYMTSNPVNNLGLPTSASREPSPWVVGASTWAGRARSSVLLSSVAPLLYVSDILCLCIFLS